MDVALPQDRYVRVRRQASPMKPTHLVGSSPYTLEFVVNYDAEKHDEWVRNTSIRFFENYELIYNEIGRNLNKFDCYSTILDKFG